MEGTGLFAGAGNKSGKISRIKKANKWRYFSNDTARMGIDTAKYGYEQYQDAVNPVSSGVKKMFGFGADVEDEEVKGGKISFKNIKKAYNKNVKNTELGKAARQSAENLNSDGYDRATDELGKYKIFKLIAEHIGKTKKGNVKKVTQMTGLGGGMRPAVMKTAVMPKGYSRDKGLRMSAEGMRLSGRRMCCKGCGMMNDQFLFQDISL